MTPEECTTFFTSLRDELKPLYRQAEVVSASVLRVRPVYLGQQPFPKRIEMMRKALALRVNAEASGELLASFILEKHSAELGELLDLLKIEHEEGALKGNAPAEPDAKLLKSAVEKFTKGENAALRSVILKAFAGQPAIEWPLLDELAFGAALAPPVVKVAKPAPTPATKTTPPVAQVAKPAPAPKTTSKPAPSMPAAPAKSAPAKPPVAKTAPAKSAPVKPPVAKSAPAKSAPAKPAPAKPATKSAAKLAPKPAAKKPAKAKGKS